MSSKNYYESRYVMEGLNHSLCIGKENLGWTSGILSNGVPFEAELWVFDQELCMSVMMPEFMSTPLEADEQADADMDVNVDMDIDNDIDQDLEDHTVVSSYERIESGLLKVGLFDRGTVYDNLTVIQYVEFLEKFGLIAFCGEEYNGGVHLYRDKAGNPIVEVIITLISQGEHCAETPLIFQSFGNGPKRFFMYKKMHI
jgi:hypothetical protein